MSADLPLSPKPSGAKTSGMRATHQPRGAAATQDLPLPGSAPAVVAVAAPETGVQRWAGAPSAALDADGSVLLAYRVRAGEDVNVIARSADGEHFTPVCTLARERFGASMVERPALVRAESG